MGRGQISRGDLLRAVLRHRGQLPADTAESLGFRPEKDSRNTLVIAFEPNLTMTAHVGQVVDTVQAFTPKPLLPVPFWQPQEFSREETATPSENDRPDFGSIAQQNSKTDRPRINTLPNLTILCLACGLPCQSIVHPAPLIFPRLSTG